MTVEDLLSLRIQYSIDYWEFKLKFESNFCYGILHNHESLADDFGEYHAMLFNVNNSKLNKDFPFIEKNL